MTAQQMKQQLVAATLENFRSGLKIVDGCSKIRLLVDCAAGVTGVMIDQYRSMLLQYYELTVINAEDYDRPNEHCGSEFVQRYKHFPKGIPEEASFDKYVSFDGDGDRIIIYFQQKDSKEARIFDGDRMNGLMSLALKSILEKIHMKHGIKLNQGICCSIIADLGFQQYAEGLGLPVQAGGANIKKIYNKAIQFDVACYFQSSGHGSVYLSLQRYQELKEVPDKSPELQLLLCLFRLCNNNPKGDAFRNFLVMELCQRYLQIPNDQLFDFYKSYNQVEIKVTVDNNLALITTPDETTVIMPPTLAAKVEHKKLQCKDCKVVIRSSTTEPIIRVRVQSRLPEDDIQRLAEEFADLVRNCEELNK